jgi:SAM-dependent methyltransferase
MRFDPFESAARFRIRNLKEAVAYLAQGLRLTFQRINGLTARRRRRTHRRSAGPGAHRPFRSRAEVADAYLAGDGIEIGALHQPLAVPERARVSYVDRLPVEELRRHYRELDGLPLVDVDIVTDGERLAPLGDDTQDFVIANHMLEHCENPLGALLHMFRVLRIETEVILVMTKGPRGLLVSPDGATAPVSTESDGKTLDLAR